MSLKILVTGGYGLVGKSLQKVVKDRELKHEFYFLSRQDCDLRDTKQTINWFTQYKPDIVVHLASRVGGVYDNINGNYNYLIDNARININVVDACEKTNVQLLINILSTCIFPNENIHYPLTSDQLHNGLPHDSNIGYAYSKRILHLASHLLLEKQNIKVVNLTPTNLYGDYDNYNLQSSHVIPGLIHKTAIAKMTNTNLCVYGTGKAMRQFLYVDDLSNVILEFIGLHTSGFLSEYEISCIVSPPESSEISIRSLIQEICRIFNFTGEIEYDTSYSDGQYKKTASSDELARYLPKFKFTSITTGLENTIKFFNENKENLRL
jgi:GDP-L-fucose synthase